VALANNDNCGLNDLNALMVRLRQLRTDFNALKTQHEATQAEIKVLKEENRKQETKLEELRRDVNNNSTEIAEISKVIEMIKGILFTIKTFILKMIKMPKRDSALGYFFKMEGSELFLQNIYLYHFM
jgi:seryl-tRNA synthetase